MNLRRPSLALAALAVLAAPSLTACRHRRRSVVARRAPAPAPARPLQPLFASPTATETGVRDWVSRTTMLAPFVTAVDGSAAALSPDGTLHWAAARGGAPVAREAHAPCRFDASRHGLYWTLPPRIALDGQGRACCVHDGDDQHPAGAYCADLRAQAPQWRPVQTPAPATGVGSGDGAMALFTTDLWCTRDGGAHLAQTFPGDPEQPLSAGSCNARGDAAAITGARGFGGVRQQTVRVAHPGGALALAPDLPRGDPADLRVLADGSVHVLFATVEGPRYAWLDAAGHAQTFPLDPTPGRALGAWGPSTVLVAPVGHLEAHDLGGGPVRTRALRAGQTPPVLVATRVGDALVGVTRDGTFATLETE